MRDVKFDIDSTIATELSSLVAIRFFCGILHQVWLKSITPKEGQ